MISSAKMWRLFRFTIIVIMFVDKSFGTCQVERPYEVYCKAEEIIRDHPFKLTGAVRRLHIITYADQLPSGTFRLLPNLEYLQLLLIGVTHIVPGAFKKLKNLTELNIHTWHLRDISNKVFDDCPNLKLLRLNDNRIESIDNEAFNKLTQLEELYLSNNLLEYVPEAVKVLSSLKVLDLRDNRIGKVSANTFSSFGSLKTLQLQRSGLEQIEDDAFKGLKELETLTIYDNFLSDLNINNIVNNLPKIKAIYLYQNSFDCSRLKEILEFLKEKNIAFGRGSLKSDVAANVWDCDN